VAWVQEQYPQVQSLRDVTSAMLDECVLPRNPLIDQRCRFVVEENLRLLAVCADLERGDLQALGRNMFATHAGLSKAYEVSCKELDFLVDAVRHEPAVIGARMMGGGFGGCTINLVEKSAVPDLTDRLLTHYQQAMQLDLTAYTVQTADGTSRIE
jgi:galactokinase